MHGLTSDARVGLLRFLASVDLVTSLRIERRHADGPPAVAPDERSGGRPTDVGDGMWVKLHDIPAVLEARSYEMSGAIVLEVIVRDGEGARVRVALDAAPDGARAVPTDRSPDLTIDAAALGAASLGGTRLRNAALAHGWDEHRPGALDTADRLLATRRRSLVLDVLLSRSLGSSPRIHRHLGPFRPHFLGTTVIDPTDAWARGVPGCLVESSRRRPPSPRSPSRRRHPRRRPRRVLVRLRLIGPAERRADDGRLDRAERASVVGGSGQPDDLRRRLAQGRPRQGEGRLRGRQPGHDR